MAWENVEIDSCRKPRALLRFPGTEQIFGAICERIERATLVALDSIVFPQRRPVSVAVRNLALMAARVEPR